MNKGLETISHPPTQSSPPRSITEKATAVLRHATRALAARPFHPHRLFQNGHAQTLVGYAWPRRFRLRAHRRDEARLFEVEPDVRVLAHCRWQQDRAAHPAMLLAHGLEGTSASAYMLGTADKAYRAGFNVVRLNFRTCGGTDDLSPTLYNSAMTGDLRRVLEELIKGERLSRLFLVGFSMGGNMALRLMGDWGDEAPRELLGVCAVSPSIDLTASAAAIERRSNWLYQRSFIRSLHRRMKRKKRRFPELYDLEGLRHARTIRQFDERFTTKYGGFQSVEEYYERASALAVLPRIARPTLIIHAQDDPFIPFEPFRRARLEENPNIILLAPARGGHVGFVAHEANGEDRFWAENRIVEFCQLIGSLESPESPESLESRKISFAHLPSSVSSAREFEK